jgi:hypothetical protein
METIGIIGKLINVSIMIEGLESEHLDPSLRAAFCNLILQIYLSNCGPAPPLILYTRV